MSNESSCTNETVLIILREWEDSAFIPLMLFFFFFSSTLFLLSNLASHKDHVPGAQGNQTSILDTTRVFGGSRRGFVFFCIMITPLD
jgi:hypothetical protein